MARLKVPKKAARAPKLTGLGGKEARGDFGNGKAAKLADRRSIYRSNLSGKGGGGGQRRDRKGRFA